MLVMPTYIGFHSHFYVQGGNCANLNAISFCETAATTEFSRVIEASFLQLPFAIRTTLKFGGYVMCYQYLRHRVLPCIVVVLVVVVVD